MPHGRITRVLFRTWDFREWNRASEASALKSPAGDSECCGDVTTFSSAGPICALLCCQPHLPRCFRTQSSPIDFRVDPSHVGQMLELRNHCGPMYGDLVSEAVPCRVQTSLEPHFRY